MKNMYLTAAHSARLQVSHGETVAILMPWSDNFRSLELAEEGGSLTHPAPGIFVRSSRVKSSLLALQVDVLIVVDVPCCEPEGIELAKEMLRLSKHPRMIEVGPGFIQGAAL